MKGNMIKNKKNFESHYEVDYDVYQCGRNEMARNELNNVIEFDDFQEAYDFAITKGLSAQIWEISAEQEGCLCVWIARPLGVDLEDLHGDEEV